MYQIFIPTKQELKAVFGSDTTEHQNGLEVFTLSKDKTVIVTGCGKTNAAICLTKYLSGGYTKVPLLIGIAGAYRESGVKIGDIHYIENDYFVDEAVLTLNAPSLQGTFEIGFPVCKDNKITYNIPNDLLPVCNANTVSVLANDDVLSNLFYSKTKAETESMEGAAFGLTAQKFNVKAVQVRAISNYCGSRSNAEWDIKKAVKSLQTIIPQII